MAPPQLGVCCVVLSFSSKLEESSVCQTKDKVIPTDVNLCTAVAVSSVNKEKYTQQKSVPPAVVCTCVRVAPGRQMGLCCVRVEDVHVLVEKQLHKLGGLQELPLAAEDAVSLLRRVQHTAAGQGEHHHERVLRTHTQAVNTHALTHTQV